MSDKTFHTTAPGHADVTLRVRGRRGSVLVIGDQTAEHATVTLRLVHPDDTVAQAQIDAAEVSGHGTQLQVIVPKPTPITTGSGTGTGVTISGGTVIAANIGGRGNTGSVSIGATTTLTHGVFVEIRVPMLSAVDIVAEEAPVIVRGAVCARIDTGGIVRTEWDNL